MIDARRVRTLTGPLDASVAVPGSKSIANRLLVCAALADGTSELSNVPDGDDTAAMVDCLGALGPEVVVDGDRVSISGAGPHWTAGPLALHAGLAGTTSRFVTALAALGTAPITIDGLPPLRRRPFGPLHDALGQLGVRVEAVDTPGNLPTIVEGPPTSGTATIRGDVSSQYVTALMLIGPYLPGGLRLELAGELVSRPYVELTSHAMSWFGCGDVEIGSTTIGVPAGRYHPTTVAVEPDASSASYPLGLAALHGGFVEVAGLGAGSLQGDARFADLLAQMGCEVERDGGSTRVRRSGSLIGLDVDMADVSDLVPTLAVVAAVATTPSRIRGVGFIRHKESDRLGDLATELRSAGVDIDETDDGLDIRPSSGSLRAARLATHHDHRLAMAFGMLATLVEGIEIEDPGVVSKSWPGFWGMLDASF